MRFRLTEDLEQELVKKQEQITDITDNLNKLFEEQGFIQVIDINGISYTFENDDINVMFYIDDELNYKGYIQSETISINVSGKMDTVEKDAQLIVDNVVQLTT